MILDGAQHIKGEGQNEELSQCDCTTAVIQVSHLRHAYWDLLVPAKPEALREGVQICLGKNIVDERDDGHDVKKPTRKYHLHTKRSCSTKVVSIFKSSHHPKAQCL